MAKARSRGAPPVSRFDGEALGLVLFALGIFLGVTVLLPQGEAGTGFMAGAQTLLTSQLGWAAWLLPVVPVAYGVLVFLGRDLGNLSRRVLGGTVMVLSLLALHESAQPGGAGLLAEAAMGPLLRAVSYLAALLPLVTLTLGAELMLRLPPLTLLKGFFRFVSVLLGGGAAQVQGVIESRQEGRESARARATARQNVAATLRDVEALRRLYPQAPALNTLLGELRAAQRDVRNLDEAGLAHLERDVTGWRETTRTFVGDAARDLREQVAAEAPDAGANVEATANEVRAGRHELSIELPSTLASGALERLRRAMVMEIQRLAQRAGRLERDRRAAEKALGKPDATLLARELPAHRERLVEWQELAVDFTAWRGRLEAYAGWPDLTAAFDRAPTEVAAQLAEALAADPDGTLADPAGWRAQLARAQEEARRRAEAMSAPPAAAPLTLDFDFTGGLPSGPAPRSGSPEPTLWTRPGEATPAFPPDSLPPAVPAHAVPAPAAQGTPLRPAVDQVALSVAAPGSAPAPMSRPPAVTRAPVAMPPAETADPVFDLGMEPDGLSGALTPISDPTSDPVNPSTGDLDPFSDWGDDDLPFGPSDRSPAAVAPRAPAPWEAGPAHPPVPSPAPAARPTPAPAGLPHDRLSALAALDTPQPRQGALPLAVPTEALLDPIPAAALNTAALDISARQRASLIDETLRHFNLQARVVDFARGPTVTRYEIEPAPGEKISRIAGLSNDLARALAVGGVRVEAPVPGKSVIGLEVPNAEREPVTFHQAAAAPSFRATRAKLPIILGKSIDGELMVGDLAKMPHLLVAGSTGSGKSVCVNTLITSLLFKYLPTELRFLMIDPKMVELTPYDGIPHLVRNVVTNPVDAAGVLLGAVAHMERRYKMMSQVGAKNLEQFNAKMRQVGETELPHLVIIIDELADLMITSPKEVEGAIMRLAQMARATGMHLVLATQRPSVDILTSLIKVNVPARIAFAVSSSHDSRTILDTMGAERLTGMGDMLFYQPGLIKPVRLQGPYISEVESARIADELRRQVFEDSFVEAYGSDFEGGVEASGPGADRSNMDFSDPLLRQAAQICIEEGQGSVSRLQRRLSVGHARAGKLMDMLESMGIVSKHQGSKPRDVLVSEADLPEYFGR
ncbi:DNA translocase FtsK [Deinococcus sp. LM3]|uniref:FtsK/SpoIIIE family DNA translocase n=1 Tax=Deinococcus sp. LM3 TaxID=1938608 RepID=UPI0009945750|nr:DNA translocase FtsK [Deinococcus sp. LM3]OOV13456.1 cell division protein FtsK [Deinococcus sp. LM3]